MKDTFAPPRSLCADAQVVFERHAERLYQEGRWTSADTELLAVFAETLVLYRAFWKDVEELGTLIPGRDGGMVKNCTPAGQT